MELRSTFYRLLYQSLLLFWVLLKVGVLAKQYHCDEEQEMTSEHGEVCCAAELRGGSLVISRETCPAGCCGERDAQKCCETEEENRFLLMLTVGLVVGSIVLLAVVAVVVFFVLRFMLRKSGKECYRKDCCTFAVRPIGHREEGFRREVEEALAEEERKRAGYNTVYSTWT